MSAVSTDRIVFRELGPARVDEWVALGHRARDFFAHRVVRLPKCGPDGFLLASRMCGVEDPNAMWELVLYAHDGLLVEFPRELFFDDDVVWHQQQFGLPGQVATASLVVEDGAVTALTLVSDLVQRIGRRREHKTRVEKVFKGWSQMLVNAVVDFAADLGARELRFATAALAARHTDRSRTVDPALFERVYDGAVEGLLPARRADDWWVVETAVARERTLAAFPVVEPARRPTTISVCHDIERGLGHVDVDAPFARRAEATSARDLEAMLAIEAEAGVRATYCVVGTLLDDVRGAIEAGGHCIAFHSFDHRADRDSQLLRCREVDYRLKGYRPPNSRITAELSDVNLLRRNFEWLASSPVSLDVTEPELRAGVVRLPIVYDDFPLHSGALDYDDWEREVLRRLAGTSFGAIGLHDCYAPRWVPRYRALLERLAELGALETLDAVAADVTLRAAA